jgi:hypothetical protein
VCVCVCVCVFVCVCVIKIFVLIIKDSVANIYGSFHYTTTSQFIGFHGPYILYNEVQTSVQESYRGDRVFNGVAIIEKHDGTQ